MKIKKLPKNLLSPPQAAEYLSQIFLPRATGNFSLIEKLFQIFSMPRKSKNREIQGISISPKSKDFEDENKIFSVPNLSQLAISFSYFYLFAKMKLLASCRVLNPDLEIKNTMHLISCAVFFKPSTDNVAPTCKVTIN